MLPTVAPDALSAMRVLSRRFAEWGNDTYDSADYPHREMAALRAEGYLHVTLPGQPLAVDEARTPALLQLLKLVGRGNLSVGRIYEGHVNALQLIHLYGTPEQRERWFADARAGHLFGVWNTEMRDGIHLHPVPEADYLRCEGSKSFCSGATHVTRPLITGQLHHATPAEAGWQMLIFPLDHHDLPVDESFWRPLGMRNSVSYKIDFSRTRVAAADLLGRPGDYQRQPYFSGGAIRFAAVHLGAAEALLDATRDYLRRLGRTENAYQRSRVARMAILVETGNLWLDRAGRLADGGGDGGEIITYANMTRTVIADLCAECLQLAERCVGARGLLHPEPFARLHTDLSMYLRQPAPDATLELVGQHYLNDDIDTHDRRTQSA